MIKSFKDKDTEILFKRGRAKRWVNIERSARRKLDMIEAATILEDLRAPPNNHLEALQHDRKGQHSIRINDQWRLCFVWKEDGAHDVEITDYH